MLKSIVSSVKKERTQIKTRVMKKGHLAGLQKFIDTTKPLNEREKQILRNVSRETTELIPWQECKYLKILNNKERCMQFMCDCKKDDCPAKFREKKN